MPQSLVEVADRKSRLRATLFAVVTVGTAAALLTFSWLEFRSHRDA